MTNSVNLSAHPFSGDTKISHRHPHLQNIGSHLRRSKRLLLSSQAWRIRLAFWGGAILVGLVCVLFAKLAELANHAFLQLAAFNPYLPLLLTPCGILGIVWLTFRYFPGAQGSGIPQTLAALQSHQKTTLLSWRIAIGKVLLTLLGLLAGGSIGRQGPSIHIGAAIMYSMRRLTRLPASCPYQHWIMAGSAAGMAAAFNTPMAGMVFVIEEMRRSSQYPIHSSIMIAVVLAGIVAISITGHYDYFGVLSDNPPPDWRIWSIAPVVGVIGGLLGGLFAQTLIKTTQVITPIATHAPLRSAFVGGWVLAIIAFLSDYSANGTGYLEAQAIIANTAEFDPWYPINKALATAASFLTGIPGGIFAPSLATGVGLGADLAYWWPVAPSSAMILLGMAAYFTGVVQSPLTAVVIVIEITAEYDMALPLLATAAIAYGVSRLVCPQPIYHSLAQTFINNKS